jgi:hypothetical protein
MMMQEREQLGAIAGFLMESTLISTMAQGVGPS